MDEADHIDLSRPGLMGAYKTGMRGTSPRMTAEMLPCLPVIIHIGPHIGG